MGTHCEQPQNKLSIAPKPQNKRKQGGGLAIYSKKSILRQKKNDGNSNISPCKSVIFKKIL
jgi:hypothetical protein